MLSVFWDQRGVIMTDYAQQGVIISGEYCHNLLRNLREDLEGKQMLGKVVPLLHDSAPAHVAHITATLAASLGYEMLPNPPYSPDLAPSHFFLFPRLQKSLPGKRFQGDDDAISAVQDFLNSQN
jgi:hypothetical protein